MLALSRASHENSDAPTLRLSHTSAGDKITLQPGDRCLTPRGAGRLPDYGSPTVRRRRLAAELRRLRERAGLTGDEVADRLGWSASKISRIELHRIGIKQADLLRLLDLYRVADVHRGSLVALADEARRTGRLEAVAASLPGKYAAFLYAEAEAKSVWTWDPQIVPGLLQTADS